MSDISHFLLTATADYATILHPNVFHVITLLITGEQVLQILINVIFGGIFAIIDSLGIQESLDIWKQVTETTKMPELGIAT
jgi:hypothetical protein